MPRILYDHLLTESGLDLLTESGDTLVLRGVGMAGDATVSGGLPGTVAGTGRVIAVGTGEVSGQPGSVAGTGQVVLHGVGTGTLTGQPGSVAGTGTVILRGVGTANGQPGNVVASGRIITLVPPVVAPSGGSYVAPRPVRAPATLRGHVNATGKPGTAAARGQLTLVGKATVSGHTGTAAARGQLTLVGAAALTAPPARISGRGDVIDELALILALAA